MDTPPNGHSNGRRVVYDTHNDNHERHFRKTFDPQIIVEGTLKEGPKSDYITFRLRLLIVDLIVIVTIPGEGKHVAPVYVKFKIDKSQNMVPGSVEIGD